MDAALEGMPAMYQVDGRQYRCLLRFRAGRAHPGNAGAIEGAYVAFALPDAETKVAGETSASARSVNA